MKTKTHLFRILGRKIALTTLIVTICTGISFAGPGNSKAKFPGGEKALHNFILKNLKYPDRALKMGVSGVVYVDFQVTKKGKVVKKKVKKGLQSDIDKEVLRVVGLMPDWEPAIKVNNAVKSDVRLPVKFTLE